MARHGRIRVGGGWCHVFTRGHNRPKRIRGANLKSLPRRTPTLPPSAATARWSRLRCEGRAREARRQSGNIATHPPAELARG